jgi:hypothetical protein
MRSELIGYLTPLLLTLRRLCSKTAINKSIAAPEVIQVVIGLITDSFNFILSIINQAFVGSIVWFL